MSLISFRTSGGRWLFSWIAERQRRSRVSYVANFHIYYPITLFMLCLPTYVHIRFHVLPFYAQVCSSWDDCVVLNLYALYDIRNETNCLFAYDDEHGCELMYRIGLFSDTIHP